MTTLNMNFNASYNFKAPAIADDSDKKFEVIFPTQEEQTIDADDDVEVVIQRAFTAINIEVNDDITLTGNISTDNLKPGDMVMIAATAKDDDRILTLASNLGGKTINLTEDEEEIIMLVFTGSEFKVLAAGTGSDGAPGATGPAGPQGEVGPTGPEGPAYTPADNSIAAVKLTKGSNNSKTYTMKSVNGTVGWVEDGA